MPTAPPPIGSPPVPPPQEAIWKVTAEVVSYDPVRRAGFMKPVEIWAGASVDRAGQVPAGRIEFALRDIPSPLREQVVEASLKVNAAKSRGADAQEWQAATRAVVELLVRQRMVLHVKLRPNGALSITSKKQ